ncbi:hypothetical protein X728_00570 [Mesorhizobium sp. L103C120A0]|nr:hypothetical protein X728_00570 [Mesorhizobium sp. L103C120A0]
MPLPAQRTLAPLHGVVAGMTVGRRDAEAPRQFGEHGHVDAGAALGHEGELHKHARLLDQRMRPGMDLADRAGPSLMRGKAHHAALGARLEFEVGRLVRHGGPPVLDPSCDGVL